MSVVYLNFLLFLAMDLYPFLMAKAAAQTAAFEGIISYSFFPFHEVWSIFRFHDLSHSYAVAAIRSGDDIKTVQGNLGHATASFTLDKYGHVTDQMKQASADRMQQYINRIKKSG